MKLYLVLWVSATPFVHATPPQRFEQWSSLIDVSGVARRSHPSTLSSRNLMASHSIVKAMTSRALLEMRGGDDVENPSDKIDVEEKRAKKRRRATIPEDVDVTSSTLENNKSSGNESDSSTPHKNGPPESSTSDVTGDSNAKKKRRRNFMSKMFSKSVTHSSEIDSERKHPAGDGEASKNGSLHDAPSDAKRRKKRRRIENRTLLRTPQEESESQVADRIEAQACSQNIDEDNEGHNMNKSAAETVIKKKRRRHRKRSPSVENSLPLAAHQGTISLVDNDMQSEKVDMDLIGVKNDEPIAEKKRVRKRKRRIVEGDALQSGGAADVATEADSIPDEKQSTLSDDTSYPLETLLSPIASSDSVGEKALDEAVTESIFSSVEVGVSLAGPRESLEPQDGVLIDSTLEGLCEYSNAKDSTNEVHDEEILPERVVFTVEDDKLQSGDLSSETLPADVLVADTDKEVIQETSFPTLEVGEGLRVLGLKDEDVIDDGSSVDFLSSQNHQVDDGDQDQTENLVGEAEGTQEISLSSAGKFHLDEPTEEEKEEVKIIEAVIGDTSTILVNDQPKESSDYREEEEQLEVLADPTKEFKMFDEVVESPDFADTSDDKTDHRRTDVGIMGQDLLNENEQMSEETHENVNEEGNGIKSSVDIAAGPSLEAIVPVSLPAFEKPMDDLSNDQKASVNAEITRLINAEELPPDLAQNDKQAESNVAPKNAIEDSVYSDTDEGLSKRDEESLILSIVTWNLGEAAPSEKEASFIRKFRTISASCDARKRGSDLVMIGAQECEDIKPRRSEGHRSRHFRRLGIQMLGEQYVPIAIHSLGGIQLALYCHRDKLGDVEMVNIADVTCGVGNVFHNKGAIGVYLKMKHRGSGSDSSIKSSRILLVTGHLAAHVKNVDARNEDFKRILAELESQAPVRFLRPQKNRDGSLMPSDGSHLLNSMDHVFFSGDLNYRIDLPREYVDRCIDDIKQCYSEESSDLDQCNTPNSQKIANLMNKLLRRDQLLQTIASGRAFSQFNEGKISFLPTFKFDKGSPDYDTSYKQRVPAWTDRIVFKSSSIRVIEYDSVPQAMHSDHRPVYGTFQLGWGKASPKNLTRSRRKQ